MAAEDSVMPADWLSTRSPSFSTLPEDFARTPVVLETASDWFSDCFLTPWMFAMISAVALADCCALAPRLWPISVREACAWLSSSMIVCSMMMNVFTF